MNSKTRLIDEWAQFDQSIIDATARSKDGLKKMWELWGSKFRPYQQRRSQEFDLGGINCTISNLGGYKLHDIEFVLGQGDKTTTKNLR